MADSPRVLLLAGAMDSLGQSIARAVLATGGKVAAAVTRECQVQKLHQQLGGDSLAAGRLLVSVVAPQDAEAAAGLVKGAKDALGEITHFAAASLLLRSRTVGREPAGDLAELLDANLHSNATLARAVLPAMRRHKVGKLVFAAVPAIAAQLSVTCRASLAAVAAFAEALASDVSLAGLQVSTLVPPADWQAPQADDPMLTPWLAVCD